MTDKQRQFLEVREGLNTPMWRWLRQYLKEQSDQLRDAGLTLLPNTPGEVIEREQTFGRAKALAELVDQIPNTINEQLKQLGEQDE